jgi:hypothetical protein
VNSLIGKPLGEEKISQTVIDAIVSLWVDPEDELSFSQIHEGLLKKGIVQKKHYRYKTDRILKRLSSSQKNLILKVGRGRYRLLVNPDEFKLFDYLKRIRQLAKFNVGGTFWRQSELYLYGMPETVLEYVDTKYALEIIDIRISQLFVALNSLAKEVKNREKKRKKTSPPRLPPQVIRELLLELMPYYLGSKAGMDFDGLSSDELNIVLSRMAGTLPEEVTPQNPTLKSLILENLKILTSITKREDEYENEGLIEQFNKKTEDFTLIVTLPEFSIDESGYEKRCIKSELREYGRDNKSSLFIASSLLSFKKQNVAAVLDVFGRKYLGRQKWEETHELYEKLYVSNSVAQTIDSFEYYDKKEKKEVMDFIQKTANDFLIKNIIFYLPFSHASLNFIIPNAYKEKILQKYFPQLPLETIHQWLSEGAVSAKSIVDQKLKDLRNALQNRQKTQ